MFLIVTFLRNICLYSMCEKYIEKIISMLSTESVISIDPKCKEENTWFKTGSSLNLSLVHRRQRTPKFQLTTHKLKKTLSNNSNENLKFLWLRKSKQLQAFFPENWGSLKSQGFLGFCCKSNSNNIGSLEITSSYPKKIVYYLSFIFDKSWIIVRIFQVLH